MCFSIARQMEPKADFLENFLFVDFQTSVMIIIFSDYFEIDLN